MWERPDITCSRLVGSCHHGRTECEVNGWKLTSRHWVRIHAKGLGQRSRRSWSRVPITLLSGCSSVVLANLDISKKDLQKLTCVGVNDLSPSVTSKYLLDNGRPSLNIQIRTFRTFNWRRSSSTRANVLCCHQSYSVPSNFIFDF